MSFNEGYGMNSKPEPATMLPGRYAGPQEQLKDISERPPLVQSASISLDARISDLQDRLNSLEKRLQPVLRGTTPSQSGQNEAKIVSVPLAETLNQFTTRVECLSMQLDSILERIEL